MVLKKEKWRIKLGKRYCTKFKPPPPQKRNGCNDHSWGRWRPIVVLLKKLLFNWKHFYPSFPDEKCLKFKFHFIKGLVLWAGEGNQIWCNPAKTSWLANLLCNLIVKMLFQIFSFQQNIFRSLTLSVLWISNMNIYIFYLCKVIICLSFSLFY